MATLLIRNLDDGIYARLKARAANQGRSMEEEARQVLRGVLEADPVAVDEDLWTAMRKIFEPLGGVELDVVRQSVSRPPPDFSGPDYDDAETGITAARR